MTGTNLVSCRMDGRWIRVKFNRDGFPLRKSACPYGKGRQHAWLAAAALFGSRQSCCPITACLTANCQRLKQRRCLCSFTTESSGIVSFGIKERFKLYTQPRIKCGVALIAPPQSAMTIIFDITSHFLRFVNLATIAPWLTISCVDCY